MTTLSRIKYHPLMSWRSVFAGTIASLLCYALLMTLGVAIGGLSLQSVIQDASGGTGLTIGAGVWTLVSVIISLFAGSYFAARISNFITFRIGAAQGVVICALFFGIMAMQVTTAVGWASRGVSSLVGSVGGMMADIGQNEGVQSTVSELINDQELRSEPEVVVKGLASRLIRGDTQGARNYLAYQTGMSPSEAQARIDSIQQNVQTRVQEAGAQAAKTISMAAWTLLALLALGTASAFLGGGIGSRENVRHPYREQEDTEEELPLTAIN